MGEVQHGAQDHFYPEAGLTVLVPVEVTVKTEGEPAEEATRAEAKLYKLTPLVDPPPTEEKLGKHDANLIDTFAFPQKVGKLTYKLDLGQFVGKAKDSSPLLVGFVFEKKFTTGPKKDTTEVTCDQRGVLLADPAVGKIEATPKTARKVGKAVKLKVTEFAAVVYDKPGVGTKAPDAQHFPAAKKTEVKWRFSADAGQTWTDLQPTGEEVTFTTEQAHMEKELVFEAYLGAPATEEKDRVTAKVDTRDVFVQLVDELGLPMKQKTIKIKLDDNSEVDVTTDDKGCLRPDDLADGRKFEFKLDDLHEVGKGDRGQAQTTASGTHLAPPAVP